MQNWKPLGLSISTVALFSALAYFLFSSLNHLPFRQPRPDYAENYHFHAPSPNLWNELDDTEAAELCSYLHKPPNILNLTKHPLGHGKENYIAMVEVLRPNKSDVVKYLDECGRTIPRYARVSVIQDSDGETLVADYMVGPLPPSTATQILPLTYPYNSGRNYVQAPLANGMAFLTWVLSIGEEISDITEDLLGAKVNLLNPEDPHALYGAVRPAMIDSGKMVSWATFFRLGDRSGAVSLLGQGLCVKLETPSANPETWVASDWYYNGVIYPDLNTFRTAWSSPDFTKVSRNLDGSWTDTEDLLSKPRGRSKPPPVSIQPYGSRYDLDRKQKYVSWMGFSFYVATAQATAVSLFDIRFNNSRIMYHLGLQEALSHYAGSDPIQSGLEFLDTFFGMGGNMFSLVPGHDCPAYADYLDITYYVGEQAVTNKNAICIFEYTSDHPLQRHTSGESVSISRNTYLVLRSVSTVGNYDYTIDYLFYLDGSIEVKVRASGFIFTAFAGIPKTGPISDDSPYSAMKRHEYGYRIHDAAMTSLHDHVLSFRADLDVAGTRNRLVRTSIKPLTKIYPWDSPEIPGPRNTMHMTHTTLATETGLNWTHNSGDMYLIQSNLTNRWGEHRAYRIQPGTGIGTPSHLTILNSTMLRHSATWSGSDLWVLQAHDTEPSGAHYLNYVSPLDPLIDFAKMANDESILDEDLVVYFNLGGHHVPSAQDIPNTLMHTSASSLLFTPFNYFDHDVSLHTRQGVRVDRREEREEDQVRYFGGRYEEGLPLKKEDLEPDLSGYLKGDDGKVAKNRVRGGLMRLFGEVGLI